ncbi:MAG: YraN family protein [Candidatus Omnitrophica bacterium]|nr:YraN family protein [Candidatus Omnitrophota bacterium]
MTNSIRKGQVPFQVSLGGRGEMVGTAYLAQKGYKILETNYRCPLGEIDVVAAKGERIVFVEIKTRSGEKFGRPEESVHGFKQRKLTQLAQWYLKDKKLLNQPAGFAVLAITWKEKDSPQIRLIENAFEAR